MGNDVQEGFHQGSPIRSRLGCLLAGVIGALLVAAPRLLWWAGPESDLRVRVVDKTVPHPSYREHEALFWVLNHARVRPPGQPGPWTLERDYVGYYPERRGSDGRAFGLPLVRSDLARIDLLVLADAYGVYVDDYDQPGLWRTHLDYSELIHGGYDGYEVVAFEDFAARGGHLVAEFNTFASPTAGWARTRLQEMLGLTWTGWSGRFLADLSDETEVPVWARRSWATQMGSPWDLKGPGWLLAHEDGRIFVLQADRHVGSGGLRIEDPILGDDLLAGCHVGIPFNFWFDVVEALPGSEVLASYRFDTRPEGLRLLEAHGVPTSFPAIVRASRDPLRLYLAGDVSDFQGVGTSYKNAGLPRLLAFHERNLTHRDQRAFFWSFYLPFFMNVTRVLSALGPVPDDDRAGPSDASTLPPAPMPETSP